MNSLIACGFFALGFIVCFGLLWPRRPLLQAKLQTDKAVLGAIEALRKEVRGLPKCEFETCEYRAPRKWVGSNSVPMGGLPMYCAGIAAQSKAEDVFIPPLI